MDKFTFREHYVELKNRLVLIVCSYVILSAICYFFSDYLLDFVTKPLSKVSINKMIYTDLAEAFIAHIRISLFCAAIMIYPIICYQIYKFISPGLYPYEKIYMRWILFSSPLLFCFGVGFLYYQIIPNAWAFFASYGQNSATISLVLEAKISEYLDLFLSLMMAFGLSFQLPVVISILSILELITVQQLRDKRRIIVVLIFIIAAILTPPDVLSQIALAIPLILLYEISIFISKIIEKRK